MPLIQCNIRDVCRLRRQVGLVCKTSPFYAPLFTEDFAGCEVAEAASVLSIYGCCNSYVALPRISHFFILNSDSVRIPVW